jgi:integrase
LRETRLISDVDLGRGILHVNRQTYPGRGGLVSKTTKGRRRRAVPIIDRLRPTLERLTSGKGPDDRLIVGPKGGVITTATLRDATNWDQLVIDLALDGLGSPRPLTHRTDLDGRQRVPLTCCSGAAGHQDPAVTARYLHPDMALAEAGSAFRPGGG